MSALPLLTAQGISRRYGSRVAVENVSLDLRRGEVLGLLGLNGAGKSTTLQILAGVLAPHRGVVAIHGHDLARAPRAAKRHLGYLPEVPPLFIDATVDEYLSFCARLHEVPSARVMARVARAKDRCNLQAVGSRLIRNLSKGFQQRVGLAQAIVHEPAVLILDEPTVGLDPAQIQEVRELIGALGTEHAILLSTHLLGEAESVCSRVVILHQGRLVYDQALAAQRQSILLGLRRPPPLAVLQALIGTSEILARADGRFEIVAAERAAVVDRLVSAAAAQGWELCELSHGGSALERTFLDLTREHRPLAEQSA
jgi:ABC-2 type transport system ATP-binding protein